MKFRTFLVGLSALSIAVAAAFFSVTGLSKLFAGASLAVILMAGTLEAGKLIAASFLYEYWDKINKLLKTYLVIGIIVLIFITSLGIYGFLTSAYQQTAEELAVIDSRVELVELKKERYNEQLNDLRTERQTLSESINELTSGLSNNVIQYTTESGEVITTTSSATRNVLNDRLGEAQEQRNVVSQRIETLSDSLTSLDIQKLNIQQESDVAAEVGPLKYLAEITGKEMSFIVNIFALLIVFVFDPLAVTLVIAFNTALRIDKNEKIKNKIKEGKEKGYQVYNEGDMTGSNTKFPDEVNIPSVWIDTDTDGDSDKADITNTDYEPYYMTDEFWDEVTRGREETEDSDEEMDVQVGLEPANNPAPMPEVKSPKENSDEVIKLKPEMIREDTDEPSEKKKEITVDDIDLTEIDVENIDRELQSIITEKKLREWYEGGGWRSPYRGDPYFTHPWFDWSKRERWINDERAKKHWVKFRGGNHKALDNIKSRYPTDFSSKTY